MTAGVRERKINVLSLFDGMAGARIALDKLGIECNYYASEVDKWAIQIAQKNYPDIIQLGDIRKLYPGNGCIYSENGKFELPEFDLVIGGSPCQGFSRGGQGLNFDDPRSVLYFEFERLVQTLKPRYFLLENVKMLDEWQDVITERLGVEPVRINSRSITAQLRDRVYWTNIDGISAPSENGHSLGDVISSGLVDRKKSYCIDANYGKTGNIKRYFLRSSRQLVFEPVDGFEQDVSRALETKNRKRKHDRVQELYKEGCLEYRILSPEEVEELQTVPPGYTNGVSDFQRYKMLGNGFTIDVIAHILSFANFD